MFNGTVVSACDNTPSSQAKAPLPDPPKTIGLFMNLVRNGNSLLDPFAPPDDARKFPMITQV
jgi:hypothetical protein